MKTSDVGLGLLSCVESIFLLEKQSNLHNPGKVILALASSVLCCNFLQDISGNFKHAPPPRISLALEPLLSLALGGRKCKVCLLVLIKRDNTLALPSESSVSMWQIGNIISKPLCLLALCTFHTRSRSVPRGFQAGAPDARPLLDGIYRCSLFPHRSMFCFSMEDGLIILSSRLCDHKGYAIPEWELSHSEGLLYNS